MTDSPDLDWLYRWAMESPRNRALEALIFLAFLMFPIQFWLAGRIIELRRRGR